MVIPILVVEKWTSLVTSQESWKNQEWISKFWSLSTGICILY